MVIRHSNQLLENLSELERSIQHIERVLDELGIEFEREKVLLILLNRKKDESSLRKK